MVEKETFSLWCSRDGKRFEMSLLRRTFCDVLLRMTFCYVSFTEDVLGYILYEGRLVTFLRRTCCNDCVTGDVLWSYLFRGHLVVQ